ncbi:hypothetical protein H0H93_013399, partial [Arthromyces matolae]
PVAFPLSFFPISDERLMKLMGLRDEEIAYDYGLSIVGLAPVSAALEARFKAVPVYRDNWEAVVKMGDA